MEYLENLLITADLQIKSMQNDYIFLSLETIKNKLNKKYLLFDKKTILRIIEIFSH